ncbi:hypothetical protein RBU61_06140 [Tissierella sp. MB52-C2]|uniref:hypothetical protein n=1 Tax=Tissierella sp. MB52-C2 TaxID=3070999 RepID=UPI00280AC10D|nr:hypothetical protein [Tissierella sp. MB52-C2]WMM26253.1 hypothetical protein RBU61_06140 [Tissierella sp. MB52-C2]
MNGFLLLIPFILIKYGLLSILNKEGLKRAAFFAPLIGREKAAYWFLLKNCDAKGVPGSMVIRIAATRHVETVMLIEKK